MDQVENKWLEDTIEGLSGRMFDEHLAKIYLRDQRGLSEAEADAFYSLAERAETYRPGDIYDELKCESLLARSGDQITETLSRLVPLP